MQPSVNLLAGDSPKMFVTSKTNSLFTFSIQFTITGLIANEKYQFWTFFPDGEPIGGVGFSSDENGVSVNPQGTPEIVSGFSSSNILPTGYYIFGINLGKFDFAKKLSYDSWRNWANSNYSVKIDLNQKITILSINPVKSVPWGKDLHVNGHLWFASTDIEKEPQVYPNGATWFIGRVISFKGNDRIPIDTSTDAFSRFSTKVQVGNFPKNRCFVQAHYKGDNQYFDECDSNIVYYDIIKHRTDVRLEVSDSELIPVKKDNKNIFNLSLEKNTTFKLTLVITDIDLDLPLTNSKVNLVSNMLEDKSPRISEGQYITMNNIKTPSNVGIYYIDGDFSGDEKYDGSKFSLQVTVLEQENTQTPTKNDIRLQEQLSNKREFRKRVFLNYAKENLEQARKVYERLTAEDLEVWFDKVSLLPGQKWMYEIEKAIKNADYVILLFSSVSTVKKGTVQSEYKLVLEVLNTVPEGKIFIIPVRLDECNLPSRYSEYHYVNMFPDWNEGVEKIIQTITNE